ncbi:MAG TPA: murein L,D-transpeptidase catalytic domain family protein [Myxococcota bacterium]|jgi:hypothetical protein
MRLALAVVVVFAVAVAVAVAVGCAPASSPASRQAAPTAPATTALSLPAAVTTSAPTLYRVDVVEPGFLALEVDVGTVALSSSTDARSVPDLAGPAVRAGAMVTPGTWFVIVDSAGASVRAALDTPASLTALGLGDDVASDALHAFATAWGQGDTDRFTFSVTDFSLRSSVPREWIVDLASGAVLWNLIVAHGEGSSLPSDHGYADVFSNVDGSHQSSLGMMRAAEDYSGTYGHSMRLDGLEPGTNDLVRPRAIVVHPWTGSRAEYVAQNGMAAETFGCPAVDDRVLDDVIPVMDNGGLFFFWYPDATWRASSPYLQ